MGTYNAARQAAIAAGERFYFTGKPCKHGHVVNRKTYNCQCVTCGKKAIQAFYATPKGMLSKNRRYREIRRAVLEKFGSKCNRCEFSDPRVLQVDHVNGGGGRETKEIGNYGVYLRKVLEDITGKYQLLCANCNAIKKIENKEYPKPKGTPWWKQWERC